MDPFSRNEEAFLNPDIDFHSMPDLRELAEERGERLRDMMLFLDENPVSEECNDERE